MKSFSRKTWTPGRFFKILLRKKRRKRIKTISFVKKIKGRRPVIPEEQRRIMVEALKPVDKAILGSLKDKLEPILKIKPDVIVLGPDQTTFDVEELRKELAKHNLFPDIVKVKEYTKCPFHSSFDIVKEIVRRFGGCKI